MKRDNTYAKRGENEAKDGESSPSNNSSSPSLPCNNNCNLTITKKRVSSPVPLFGSMNNLNVPPTWTHHTRQISEESTTSATSESSTNRTDSVANSAASSQDDSTSVSVSVGLQDYKSGNWWVESTHQVPLYYPLAASSCFVENEVVATVSSRISNCLVDRSIAAMYSGAVANATTLDGVTFYIRLFRGSGSYATGIVVELQHRTGNPLTFHKTCHVIFEAAKGKPYLGLPDHVKPPPLDKNKKTTVITDREHLILSLEKAYELLEKDRIDANRLGMEMLSIMTNPEQTNAVFVAETVILGRDILGSSIYERIHDLLQYSHHQQMETDDDDDRRDEVDILRPLALQVLRNALVVLSRGTDMREIVQGIILPEWMVDSLIPMLLSELQNVETDPIGAFLAVESLTALLGLSDRALSIATEQNALSIIEHAQDFGNRYHALLGQASTLAATTLRSYMNCKTEKD